jgi:hypothetical protein
MEPIAEDIEALGWALRALGERPVASGSRMNLSHVDYTLTGPWAGRPLLESYTLARMNTAHAADHLLAIAACIRAEGVIFALITLQRALLESGAQAFYLWADDIDTRERVRRWANLSLDSEMELLRLGVGASADDEATIESQLIKIGEILESARKHGFTVNDQNLDKQLAKNPLRAPAPFIGARPPSVMRLVDDALAGAGIGVGETTYRLASAVAHAQPHGHRAFWIKDQSVASGRPGVSTVPIGMTGSSMITWLAPSVMVAHAVALPMIAACGWSDTVWQKTAQPVLRRWAAASHSAT